MNEASLPGTLAFLLGAFALLIIALFVSFGLLKRALLRRLASYEGYRRQQHADLAARVEANNERALRDAQAMMRLLSDGANNNEARVEKLLARIEQGLDLQRAENEKLRETVDTRLRETLEKRLGASFQQVSEQLERVYRGLGEMQRLATGVGDLKRVLSGVKTRGIWGEVRLGALIEQNLSAEQYLTNTPVEPGATERVEFAVRLPGKSGESPVLLPIDSKFPQESYQRLLEAQEAGDKSAAEQAGAQLERAILEEGKRIAGKYIRVPHTTDFAVMFLPAEGLYAEALRRPGLMDKLQSQSRVILCGPTTLSALLTSLQVGFRTLAVEARSEEIWRLLGSVRSEFYRFGETLERTRQRLQQANDELDAASTRTRQINRQLGRVEDLNVPIDWDKPPDRPS